MPHTLQKPVKMNEMIHKIKVFSLAFAFPLAIFTAPLSHSAPGNLADAPLFLANPIQPNIAFMFDDSGSMDWEILLNAGTFNPGSTINTFRNNGSNRGPRIDFTPETNSERRATCRGFNVFAYDPTFIYTPWVGVDEDGDPYTDMTLAVARDDPYQTEDNNNDNIRNHIYFEWNDENEDEEYNGPAGEGGSADAPSSDEDECGNVSSNTGGVRVRDLPTAFERQNYANWYSYYRKREYVAKRALSQIISESTSRMGLARINDFDEEIETNEDGDIISRTITNTDARSARVENINDISLPLNTDAQTNKTNLLRNLFRDGSTGLTPLREALVRAGNYFEGNNTNWGPSPILPSALGGECQQNFTILISDGFWNGNAPSVGNTDIDSTASNFDGGSYADQQSNTLADVAMHYYERDLSGLDDNVRPNSFDPDPNSLPNGLLHQHMKTFTIAFGLNGTLSSNPTDRAAPFTWPTPTRNNLTTVDDMRHAAWNGRGEFLNAGNPEQLITSLNAAISSIDASRGSAAAVSFNTTSLDNGTDIYLALLDSANWSGDLQAFPLDPFTGDIASSPRWSAAAQLDARNISSSPRTILSYNGTNGIPFQWNNLTTDQRNDFRTNTDQSTSNDALAEARLDFLRGDRGCQTNNAGACAILPANTASSEKPFRERDSRLGDIINSAPTFVAAPTQNWPDTLIGPNGTSTTPYSSFRSAAAQINRPGIIYSGANDGMLHGFSEIDGEEKIAYVPSYLFSTGSADGLHYLSDPNYSHRFYVDLTPTVSDAYVRTTSTGTTEWNTILIGGSGAGGRGLFALDITNPNSFSESNTDTVMWEFSSADDPDLGLSISSPTIAPMNNGRWAAIFGNGYNDAGGSGQAQLFIVYLDGGLDGEWTLNTDYFKITTEVGTQPDMRNGLATPGVIDNNGDGTADRAYAGDLRGNMWAFDLSSSNPNNWDVAFSEAGGSPRPLFTAPNNQPITTTPAVIRNPLAVSTPATEPNTIVLFGTGQYIVDGDQTNTSDQAFYGIWDSGATGGDGSGISSSRTINRDDLVQQVIDTGATNANTEGATVDGRTLTNSPVDYSGGENGDDGWYINLPIDGERSVTDAVIRGNLVFFNTIIPDSDPCNSGGTSFIMVAESATGGGPSDPVIDINNDGLINQLDQIGNVAAIGKLISGIASRSSILGNRLYTGTSESGSTNNTSNAPGIDETGLVPLDGPGTGRLSWEEINQ